jgi:hypothetical protein
MRIRIVKPPTVSSIDGIQLGYFVVGLQYELGQAVASLLLAEGWAEPVDGDAVDDRRIAASPDGIAFPTNPRTERKAFPPFPPRDKPR